MKTEEDYQKLESYCKETTAIVRKFVMGEAIPDDTSFNRNYIGELLHNFQQKNIYCQTTVDEELPPLSVTMDATGDYKINALRTVPESEKSYAEYQYSDKGFDAILYSPWSRFEAAGIAERKHKIASEIARRAMTYPTLVEELKRAQQIVKSWVDGFDSQQKTISKLEQKIESLTTHIANLTRLGHVKGIFGPRKYQQEEN